MKGKNIIKMNQPSMVAAMQLWVDAEFKNPPVVKEVKLDRSIINSTTDFFEVHIEDGTP